MSSWLVSRQYRALSEICDAFCPSGDGLPSATELGVPGAVVEAVARNPRRSERQQLAALLSLWDTAALGGVSGAGFKRFSALSREERERVLLRWGDSRVVQQRAVFQALRKAALLFYYMLRSPAWDAIGYPGPLGPRLDAPPKALTMTEVSPNTQLECDVVIVGSGAGGGAGAGVLAGARLDAVVVASGGYYDGVDVSG